MQQPNYYSIIPASVRYCKDITGDEKLLFSELTCLANKFGYCYASNRYFAELYGVSKKTITRRLANLKKHRFIRIIIDKNENNEVIGRRIYLLDLPTADTVLTPRDKSEDTPVDNNVHTPTDNIGGRPMDTPVPTPMDKSIPYNITSKSNNTSLIITRENNRASPTSCADEIISAFNNICISLSPYPKLLDKDRNNILEIKSKNINYHSLFHQVEQSDFLSGRNGKWNGCTFSWIIQPANIEKIFNGNYDNPLPVPTKSTNKFFELVMNMEDD